MATMSAATITATRKLPSAPSAPWRTIPTISMDAIPIPRVMGSPTGSRPGWSRRPSPPTTRPMMTSPMMKPIVTPEGYPSASGAEHRLRGDVNEHVLLVEDDASIREVATLGLEQAGFRVTASGDGRDGLIRFRQGSFDLVVLDVMLPSLDGFEVLREIRGESRAPVVMLSARDELHDIVVGLELGADDYVTKPFELPELVARIKAVLRRSAAAPTESVIAVDGLEIDPAAFSSRREGDDLELTATEFRLLLELARRPKQVFTRELLLELVWNYDYLGDSRLVDVAVQRLRAKIEADPANPKLIHTVRGVGYQLAPE